MGKRGVPPRNGGKSNELPTATAPKERRGRPPDTSADPRATAAAGPRMTRVSTRSHQASGAIESARASSAEERGPGGNQGTNTPPSDDTTPPAARSRKTSSAGTGDGATSPMPRVGEALAGATSPTPGAGSTQPASDNESTLSSVPKSRATSRASYQQKPPSFDQREFMQGFRELFDEFSNKRASN